MGLNNNGLDPIHFLKNNPQDYCLFQLVGPDGFKQSWIGWIVDWWIMLPPLIPAPITFPVNPSGIGQSEILCRSAGLCVVLPQPPLQVCAPLFCAARHFSGQARPVSSKPSDILAVIHHSYVCGVLTVLFVGALPLLSSLFVTSVLMSSLSNGFCVQYKLFI